MESLAIMLQDSLRRLQGTARSVLDVEPDESRATGQDAVTGIEHDSEEDQRSSLHESDAAAADSGPPSPSDVAVSFLSQDVLSRASRSLPSAEGSVRPPSTPPAPLSQPMRSLPPRQEHTPSASTSSRVQHLLSFESRSFLLHSVCTDTD